MKTVRAGNSPRIRIAFWTLGCRLNQYDTEGMKSQLAAGLTVEVVPWATEADVYVLNSCTVTGKADQECRRLTRQIKRKHPQSKVVVTGCYAQTQPDRLLCIPEVDGVVGNTAKDSIGEWLPALLHSEESMVRVDDFPTRSAFSSPIITEFDGRSRAFVKVQEGCDLRCAYCLIWRARGPARSRSREDLHHQLATLIAADYREVVLAGVHLGSYGRDLSPRICLVELLRGIVADFPDLRLRLSSIHPNEITPELLSLWSEHHQLRPHLHISLQSGSDSVLKRMRRPYHSEAVREAVTRTANAIPHCGIGADLIVGFPAESDVEFAASMALVEALPFTYLHVFRFSPRPGTPAASMSDQVHPEAVTERSAILRELAQCKKQAFTEGLLGQRREAVVETVGCTPGWQHGTTDNYASIMIPGYWTEGSLVRCRADKLVAGQLHAADVEPIDGFSAV